MPDTNETHDMKFDQRGVRRLRDGEKNWTVRAAPEWRHVTHGDQLRHLNTDAEEVGYSTVGMVADFPAESWHYVSQDDDILHREYDSLQAFLDAMRSYYPNTEWTADTHVVAMKLEGIVMHEPDASYAWPEWGDD